MANFPYGLRQDPFVAPATLSAKEASRLIRRRVGAFGGDGGALFPIATCDEIHRLTCGIPDAILELAGKALHAAAAAGAPAVTVANVRSAAEAARVSATAGADDSRVDEAKQRADATAARGKHAVAVVPAAAPTSPAGPRDDVAAIDDADSDLPPFRPASFALPARPSEDLGRDAQEWVSRFIPEQGVGPSFGAAAYNTEAPTFRDATALGATVAPRGTTERPPAPLPAVALPRPVPRSRRPRKRRRGAGRGLVTVAALVCVLAFVVRYSTRGSLFAPTSEARRAVPASEPTGGGTVPASDPAVATSLSGAAQPVPTLTATPAAPEGPTPDPVLQPVAPPALTPASPAATLAPHVAGAATVDSSRRAPPAAKYALEVATFIFEERARVERTRLAAAGHRARVLSTWEYGSRVYRVVLGGYARPGAAERAADSLLSSGLVLQARVITLPTAR